MELSDPFFVPAVYLTLANSLFLWFLPFSRISKLRGISGAQNSDSPRLHFVEPRNDRGVEPLLLGVAVFFLLNPLDVFWVVDNDNAGAVLTLFQSAYLLASEDRSGSVRSIPQRWNTSEIFAAVSGSRGAAR